MPHFQVRVHMQMIHDLATEISRQDSALNEATGYLVRAVEGLASLFELSPLRHVRFSEVATGFGGVEVLLEEALEDVQKGQGQQALEKCRIALKMVDRVHGIISHDQRGRRA